MTAEVKSSDEILQELFGMCKQKSIDSSEQSSHSQSESDVDDDASATKKHKKKKKKKHKKHKKRGRSSSDESDSSDRKSHKRKKKKSHKDDDRSKKLKVKIKTEPGEPPLPYDELVGIEKRDKVTDTATGKKMTIDDVFNSLGIAPKTRIKVEKGLSPVHVKKENGCDVKPNLIPEGPALPVPPPTPAPAPCPPASSSDKAPLKVEKDADTNPNSSNKTNLSDVFDAEPTLLADKSNSKTKKINIDNLKHSSVYEATIKEVEERERKKAEKYEEGELSSSSSSSQDELSNDDDLQQESETDSKKKEKRRHKHKHRSKSKDHERSKSKHRSRSHHRKHSHEKTSHKEKDKDKDKDKEHKSRKSSVSPSRHSRSSKSYYDHHHHSAHHRPYHYSSYYSRASSVEGRGSSRSHTSREEKRGTSNDRIHSRIRGKITSKERSTRSKSSEKIDKQKLLEIARKNAITLLKQGALPASVVVNTKDKIASIKAGGKTVDELTDFCKQLSKKEALGQESLSSGSDLDEEREKAFHHPFQLKERPSSIVMNIRNAVPLPTKTAQEKTLELSKQLSLQYPVSSGQHHSTYESEWVPVEKTPDPPAVPAVVPPPQKITGSEPSYALNYPLVSYPTVNYNGYSNKIPLPQAPSADIGSIVAERLEAIRRLTENPSDPIGNDLIQVAENKMKVWAESKVQPGLFTGSTGVRTLSAAELSSGFKAWPKKLNSNWKTRLTCWLRCKQDSTVIVPENMLQNQFIAAKPVISDKGEALMKKMGWQPGEGLGKYKQGPPEPCEIAMKTDRKGLAEQPAVTSFQQTNVVKRAFELSHNKHPVSLLNEYCSRKKIGTPQYDCEERDGAGKRKLFVFSVTVKGMKYTPHMPCCNKKQSKIEAATLCLQNLGLLPTG